MRLDVESAVEADAEETHHRRQNITISILLLSSDEDFYILEEPSSSIIMSNEDESSSSSPPASLPSSSSSSSKKFRSDKNDIPSLPSAAPWSNDDDENEEAEDDPASWMMDLLNDTNINDDDLFLPDEDWDISFSSSHSSSSIPPGGGEEEEDQGAKDDHRLLGTTNVLDGEISSVPEEEEKESSSTTLSADETPTMTAALAAEQAVDAMLQREMAKLSMREREQVDKELHGILDHDDTEEHDVETPERRRKGLDELKEFLNRQEQEEEEKATITTDSSMKAYLLAKSREITYVEQDSFRLLFLRQCKWDIPAAAASLLRHFTIKLELFGEDLISRDICWYDLSEREQAIANSGFHQLLPERDRAGRSILLLSALSLLNVEASLDDPPESGGAKMDPSAVIESRCRVQFYLVMKYLQQDEISQINGLVVVVYAVGDVLSFYTDLQNVKRLRTIRQGIPFRLAGSHFCHSNVVLRTLAPMIRLMQGSKHIIMTRTHYTKSIDEIKLVLGSFGIPANAIPELVVDRNTGKETLDTTNHARMMDQIRAQEATGRRMVNVPHRHDVLFGRANEARHHSGNFRCLYMVNLHRPIYENASKSQKTQLHRKIIRMVNESGGRFLKQTPLGWEEVEDKIAADKIGHFFRRLRYDEQDGRKKKNADKEDAPAPSSVGDGRKRERE